MKSARSDRDAYSYRTDPNVRQFPDDHPIHDGIAWFRSEGSIRMFEGLGFPYSLARVFRVLPLPVRDALYNGVAKRRLSLFGQLEQCYVPPVDYRDRLIA